ncbi:NAP57 isoform 1 [Hibiscus syriacus]|uniref:NAP57 isoform 1 n=2 Tax=Hibiscus syriacus TaxID=106335 RepID=A0A6A2ZD69_HIBSY|nr:NAP57 isoform 1 [Hibiscus syriacus]
MANDPEAEKIQLRHQTEKGRKNTEEWMLDHALRQVISTLAPSQKRKVAMLVQAFETVIPAKIGDDLRSNTSVSSTTAQDYNESSVDNDGGKENENTSEISPGKPLNSEMDSSDDYDQVGESNVGYLQSTNSSPDSKETDMKKEDDCAIDDNNGNEVSIVNLSLSEFKEPRISDKSLTDEDAMGTSHDKFFTVNEDVQRIAKEEILIQSSEVCNTDSEFGIKKMDMESSDTSNSPYQSPCKPECLEEVGEGYQPKHKFLHSPLEQSDLNFEANISLSERQKYTRLWYLIYKHMVSGSTTENGSQPLAGEEVQGNDASKHPKENNADRQGPSAAGQNMIENYSTGHNNEIIKLVEEAIDEIPLPEIQDDTSENQSVGEVIPDQELPEKNYGQEEVKIITSSTGSAKENYEETKTIRTEVSSTLTSKEKILNSQNVNTNMEAKGGIEEGNKSKKRVQRNWSNLKKLVLLRRFVKALEKVKEFNPRGPRYLPVDPTPESEKVLLRHQNMRDRKNAEEWMLDYALQQVVAKLTPERKRRVGLLVEAFETVIPTIS